MLFSAALLARLGATDPVWRVDFVFAGADDRIARRNDVSADDIANVIDRLARLDRTRAWTQQTLQLIGTSPGTVSTVLAHRAGQERAAFKANVRKLKELGLTESLEIGYRLSPRGEAVLHEVARRSE